MLQNNSVQGLIFGLLRPPSPTGRSMGREACKVAHVKLKNRGYMCA
jgi:hypothetical protein